MNQKKLTAGFMRGYRSAVELQPTQGRSNGRDRVLQAVVNGVDLAQREVADLIKEAYAEVTAGATQATAAASVTREHSFQ